MKRAPSRGFTLIEIVITVALMVILTGVYFLAANPGGQLAGARNSERLLNLQAIMNAVRQNVADQPTGQFACAAGAVPTTTTVMKSAAGGYNIGPCLVPTYIFSLPTDPSASSSYYNSATDYNTAYTIAMNASGTITLAAPAAELGKTISVAR